MFPTKLECELAWLVIIVAATNRMAAAAVSSVAWNTVQHSK